MSSPGWPGWWIGRARAGREISTMARSSRQHWLHLPPNLVSRIGVRVCWPSIWESASRRWPKPGTDNPRIHVHFTPTSASWLNLVEVWFSIIERQSIHRGTFGYVGELTRAIRTFITGWNKRTHPFVWTKTADEILKKANRQPTSNTDHQ
jgi:hypothetical protein